MPNHYGICLKLMEWYVSGKKSSELGRIMPLPTPKDVSVFSPGSCQYVTFLCKRKLAAVIKDLNVIKSKDGRGS